MNQCTKRYLIFGICYRDGIYSTDYEDFVPKMYEWPDIAYPDHKAPKNKSD